MFFYYYSQQKDEFVFQDKNDNELRSKLQQS